MVESLLCVNYNAWYINMSILPTMISRIPPILGLGTRKSDPDVYVVIRAPSIGICNRILVVEDDSTLEYNMV